MYKNEQTGIIYLEDEDLYNDDYGYMDNYDIEDNDFVPVHAGPVELNDLGYNLDDDYDDDENDDYMDGYDKVFKAVKNKKEKDKKKKEEKTKKNDIKKTKKSKGKKQPDHSIDIDIDMNKSIDDAENEIVQLLFYRDELTEKLNKLDIHDIKDYKRIVIINMNIRKINTKLRQLELMTGMNLSELNTGTKFGRFMYGAKKSIKKKKKKASKFCKKHPDIVFGILSVVGTIAVSIIGLLFGGPKTAEA